MRHALARIVVVLAGLLPAAAAFAERLPGTAFASAETQDAFGRPVTYYLSEVDAARPLALVIQGSGCNALFRPIPGGYSAVGYHNVFRSVGGDRYRVLAVEKPGARTVGEPPVGGTTEGCPARFLEEHTVERWAAALAAAMAAARADPLVAAAPMLVIGHSEGGVLAARLARLDPRVGHVALLASPGPDPVEELALWGESRGRARSEIAAMVARIRATPDSATDLVFGHPHRRWSSFLAADPLADLLASGARVFLAQGDADANWPVAAHDALARGLRAAARPFAALRLAGADHGLTGPGQKPPEGMIEIFRAILRWTADTP